MKLASLIALIVPVLAWGAEDDLRAECTFKVRKFSATVHFVSEGTPLEWKMRITFSDLRIPEQVIPLGGLIEQTESPSIPQCDCYDYNGDGFTDLSVAGVTGHARNRVANFYFYNPASRRFESREDVDQACVAEFDPRTKEFSVYWRKNGFSAGSRYYRFEHDRLRLVRTRETGYAQSFRDILPNAPEFTPYLVTTLYWPDGRVRRTFYKYIGK